MSDNYFLTQNPQNWQLCKNGPIIDLNMIVRFGISDPKLGNHDTTIVLTKLLLISVILRSRKLMKYWDLPVSGQREKKEMLFEVVVYNL